MRFDKILRSFLRNQFETLLEERTQKLSMANKKLSLEIEQKNQVQRALEKSKSQYHMLFKNLTAGFALHEIILNDHQVPCDYRFIQINPAFETLTGLMAKDVVGRTVLEILPDTEPFWIETYGKVATSAEPYSFENYSQSLDKHYSVTVYSPEPGKFATLFFDISDRVDAQDAIKQQHDTLEILVEERTSELSKANESLKESEKSYRNIFNSISDAIFITDQEGNIKDANPAACEMYGYSLKEFSSLNAMDLIHPDYLDRFRKFADDLSATGRYKGETIDRKKDGTTFNTEVKGTVFYYGGKSHLLGIIRDVTEQKQTEKLKLEQKKLQGVLEMAGAVSHELNQPLQIITGYSEILMLDMKKDDPKYEKIKSIDDGTRRMGQLMNKIMGITRYESKPYLKNKIVDIEQASQSKKEKFDQD